MPRELAEHELKVNYLPFALTSVSFGLGGETRATEAVLIRKVSVCFASLVAHPEQFDIQMNLSETRVWCFSSCSGLMTLICEHTA